jgi:hypothetical protein
MDLDKGEVNSTEIPLRIQHKGLLWISETICAISLGTQLLIYDHTKKRLKTVYEVAEKGGHITLGDEASPDGERIIFSDTAKGVFVMETATLKPRQIELPNATGLEWIGANELLAIMNVADSEARGTWLIPLKEGKEPIRLLNQPIYERSDPKNPMQKLIFPEEKSIFKSKHTSFLLDTKTGDMKQIELKGGILEPIEQIEANENTRN